MFVCVCIYVVYNFQRSFCFKAKLSGISESSCIPISLHTHRFGVQKTLPPHRQCLFAVSSGGRRSKVAVFSHFYKVTSRGLHDLITSRGAIPKFHDMGDEVSTQEIQGDTDTQSMAWHVSTVTMSYRMTLLWKSSVLYVLNPSFLSAPASH